MLALRRRVLHEPVGRVGADDHLGGVAAECTGQRNDLDGGGLLNAADFANISVMDTAGPLRIVGAVAE